MSAKEARARAELIRFNAIAAEAFWLSTPAWRWFARLRRRSDARTWAAAHQNAETLYQLAWQTEAITDEKLHGLAQITKPPQRGNN